MPSRSVERIAGGVLGLGRLDVRRVTEDRRVIAPKVVGSNPTRAAFLVWVNMAKPKPLPPTEVRCWKCGRRQPKSNVPNQVYFCETCQMCFDEDPNEGGGDYDYRDPSRRLTRREKGTA